MTIEIHPLPQPFAGGPTITGRDALALIEEAWQLTASTFARQQLREYQDAQLASGRKAPPGLWHPWIPGFAWWVPLRLVKAHRLPPPPAAILVVHDMLALKEVPGVLPAHQDDVVRRIMRQPQATLWELRAAALYAGAGIEAEWAEVTSPGSGRPDVWIPGHEAAIQVKCLEPHEEPLDDLERVFGNLHRAHHQLKFGGPTCALIAIPRAYSFKAWDPVDSPFRKTLRDWFSEPEFARVSAVTFAGEPRFAALGRRGLFHFGHFAWSFLNPNAAVPWPKDLPLLSDGPGAS
ncbi:MAG: hypothetical protein KGJ98_13540 [Chloroflexota bacterium]|nr:hypothetical protein [Chloroflexota bacterium]